MDTQSITSGMLSTLAQKGAERPVRDDKFDIRDHLGKLIPAKGKNRYVCPICEKGKLTVDPKTAKYQCWDGCTCKDIREAVAPWNEVKGRSYQPIGSRKPILKPKATAAKFIEDTATTRNCQIPSGDHQLAKLPTPIINPEKRKRGNETEIEYWYSENQWVRRTERPDPTKPKGYDKKPIPYHIDEAGLPKSGRGNAAWNPYRIDEVIAHADGKWVIGVEGETCVEATRYLGFVAFTFQGSKWSEPDLEQYAAQLKEAGIMGIYYCADHDETGYKKAAALEKACAKAQLPFILIAPSTIWSECPHNGDIADWVNWTMEEGWSKEQAQEHLEKLFRAAVEEEQKMRERMQEIEEKAWEDEEEDYEGNSRYTKQEFIQRTFNLLYGDKPWICVQNKLYFWTGTHYKHSVDVVEIRRIAEWCDAYAVPKKEKNGKTTFSYPYAKPSKVEEIFKWLKMRLAINPELTNPPGINCTNGVVEVRWEGSKPSRHLEPHDPSKHYYLYEPLIEYNPKADTTNCNRLLLALDEAQQKVLLRNLAAAIDLHTVRKFRNREVRAILACGLGANGKDAIRQTVSTIFGHAGMTSVSLADFALYDEGRKFALSPLINSRINWASENPQTARLDRIQSLKLFATGNILHSERKGQDHIEFIPKAVGLFNLNETPALQGVMQAIVDRIAVIKFTKTFKNKPNPKDPNELQADPRFAYDNEFIQTHVAPAFLNKMLDALEALMEEGIDYGCTSEAFQSMQKENNHLLQFCEDVGLGYIAEKAVTAMDVWSQLEEWYQANGTLTIEEGGKRIWAEQAKVSDKNVKAPNQVISRFRQLFPRAKLIMVPHPNDGKKKIQVLQGIGFQNGDNTPDGTRDNNPLYSAPIPTPIFEAPTPIPPQSPPQQTTENQGFHPTHPNFDQHCEKNEKHLSDLGNVSAEATFEKTSDTPHELGWVGCDAPKSSIPEVDTGVGNGVETGVGVSDGGEEAPLSAQLMMHLICDATSWAEVEAIVAVAPSQKRQVWELLPSEQKQRVREMMQAARSRDLAERRLNGKRVLISGQEGVVLKDCGYSSSRILEVRMNNGEIKTALSVKECSLID